MKFTNLFLLTIFTLLTFSSCSNDNDDNVENDLSLVGTWELKEATNFTFEMRTNNESFNEIIKNWSKDNPVYSHASLNFEENGSFSYAFKIQTDEKEYNYPGTYAYRNGLLYGDMKDENDLSTKVSTKIEIVDNQITISNQSWLYNFSNNIIKQMLLYYAEDLKGIDLSKLKIENISFSMTLTKK